VSPEQRQELAEMIRAARRAGARGHVAIMAVVVANAARAEGPPSRHQGLREVVDRTVWPMTAACPAPFSVYAVRHGFVDDLDDGASH